MNETKSKALPMPSARPKLTQAEMDEYRERQRQHYEQHPDYEAGWHRPSKAVAEAVWNRLAKKFDIKLADLLPADLFGEGRSEVELRLKQAFTVTVGAAVEAAERGNLLTTNVVFDALAQHWSDNYRAEIERGPAKISYDMRAETIKAAWRDLLRNGIRLEAFSRMAQRGCPGLYVTKRQRGRGHAGSYSTRAVPGRLLTWFQEATGEIKPAPSRLLLADEKLPEPEIVQRVAGGRPYLVVTPGERSRAVIRKLEAARFYLDIGAFRKTLTRLQEERDEANVRAWDDFKLDVEKLATASARQNRARLRCAACAKLRKETHDPRRLCPAHKARWLPLRSLLQVKLGSVHPKNREAAFQEYKRYVKALGQIHQLEQIETRLHKLEADGRIKDGLVQIRSGFRQIMTRRYHPTHFWPLEVTGKEESQEKEVVASFGDDDPDVVNIASRRGRWFLADAIRSRSEREQEREQPGTSMGLYLPETWDRQPLVEYDISSSQVQLLSVFFGLRQVEAKVTKTALKEILAAEASKMHDDPHNLFKIPGFDGTEDPYLQASVKKAGMTFLYGSEPREIAYKLSHDEKSFGPGLGNGANVERLINGTILGELAKRIRPVLKAVAEVAYERDPYAGVILTNPFDGTAVRWNYVKRRQTYIRRADVAVAVNLPSSDPNKNGDYKVDLRKLRLSLLADLVQLLDAAFAGFVVEELHKHVVTNVVSVHDSWLVAAEAEARLVEAIKAAGEPWLRSLGPVYDDLIGYLTGTPFEQQSRQWKATWTRRVAEGRWPRFLAKKSSTLWAEDVRF
ncbi:MAG TPA: hypothetical protein VJX92_03280 [Methylomirabilota bacterium]|nr:hypothetical protein [Methylomirabilota bacterium]